MVTVSNISVKGPALTVIPSRSGNDLSRLWLCRRIALYHHRKAFFQQPERKSYRAEWSGCSGCCSTGRHFADNRCTGRKCQRRIKTIVLSPAEKEYPQRFLLRKPYTGTRSWMPSARIPGFSCHQCCYGRDEGEICPDFYNKIEAVWNSSSMATVFLRDDITLKKHNQHFTSLEYVRNNADPAIFFFFFFFFYLLFLMTTTSGNITQQLISAIVNILPCYPKRKPGGGPGQGGRPDYFLYHF